MSSRNGKSRVIGVTSSSWISGLAMIARVATAIVLTLVYFLVLTPVAIVRRIFGGNPLRHPLTKGGYWVRRSPAESERANMRRRS